MKKNKGVPGPELATYRHAHQKRVHCCIHVSRVFFFLFWWDVALYPTLKQTAVLGCIKSSTSAVTRALRCQLRGRPFHPWAGRLRFSGEAHPGPATLTQSSSFSCGAGLQIESRLLLCCAPAVYTLADAAAVAAAVFFLEHLISYCNYTKRSFGPTSRGQGRRLCHAMPNYRPGEVNPKQQLPSVASLLVKAEIAVLLCQCPRAASCLLL